MIRFLAPLIIALLCAGYAKAQGLPPEWKQTDFPGFNQAWVNAKKPGHMIVLTKNKSATPLSFKDTPRLEILAGIAGFRQITLAQLGFKDFKISEFNYSISHNEKVMLVGSYIRPGNIKVEFYENQFYAGTSFEQISYLIEGSKAPANSQEIYSLLDKVTVGSRLPAQAESRTEAAVEDVCADCDLAKIDEPAQLHNQIKEVAKAANECAKDAWLFDPAKRSILKENGAFRVTESPVEVAARAFLTCNYGSMAGAAKSFRDVVMAVPNLIGMGWSGLKSASTAVKNFEYSKWLGSFSVQKVKDAGAGALMVSASTVAGAFNKASLTVYNTFKEGGVTGAIASVGAAAYSSSPHQAVGQLLSKIGSEIYEALSTEWTALACMEPEALSQAMCEIAGYLAVDIVTGKVLLSALSKSGKLKSAIATVRQKMEKVPIASEFITRNLKSVDGSRCGKVDSKDWKSDSGFKLQGQSIDVVREGALILARGISPKTGMLECYEVSGTLVSKVSDRIRATEKRSELVGNRGGDYFSAGSSNYARSTDEFIAGVNEKVGVEVSSSQSRKIAEAMTSNPEQMERYGDLTRQLDSLKQKAASAGLAADELPEIKRVIVATEESMRTVNNSMPLISDGSKLNLKAFNEAVNEAVLSKNPEGLQLMNRALFEFNKSAKGAGSFENAVSKWETALKSERRHLTSKDIDRAKQCLFTGAK